MSKAVEKATHKLVKINPKTGALTANPVGFGLSALFYSGGMAPCQTMSCDLDGDGFADEDFQEGLCRPGFN